MTEQQEPVAWTDENFMTLHVSKDIAEMEGANVALYAAPPKREPLSELTEEQIEVVIGARVAMQLAEQAIDIRSHLLAIAAVVGRDNDSAQSMLKELINVTRVPRQPLSEDEAWKIFTKIGTTNKTGGQIMHEFANAVLDRPNKIGGSHE